MDVVGIVSAAGSVATAVAVGLAFIELRLRRLQDRTAFEDSIVQEYRQTIRRDLISGALVKESLADEDIEAEFPRFYAYIDLCNEEVFLRSVGRVSRSTWHIWVDGIRGNLQRRGFKESWEKILQRTPDDFQELQLLQDSRYRDPREWTPRWDRLVKRREFTTAEAGERLARSDPPLRHRDDWLRRAREERERKGNVDDS